MKIIVNNKKETVVFAKSLAAKFRGGEVLALIGDLGAGKTTFTQALGKALGVKQKINSPTFVVMKVYLINQKSKIKNQKINKFVHIDAYRLETERDLMAIGVEEYFADKNCVTVIEWAEKVKKCLPRRTKIITFKSLGESAREIKY